VRAQNQDLLITISELKALLKIVEKAASIVRRPSNRDSPLKDSVLSNTKNSSEKVDVSVRTNKKANVASKNVVSNKNIVTDVDVKNALKAKDILCVSYAKNVVWSPIKTTPNVVNSRNTVVQIVLWIVDSGCSKHMTGDRSLLKNFIEKFLVFCDDDLEVAFHSKTCYVRNLEEDDLLTGAHESNLYTISIFDIATSSPVYLYPKPLQQSHGESMNTPSKEDLDNSFGPMYEEYFEKRSSEVCPSIPLHNKFTIMKNPSTSSIIVEEHEAPPIVTTSEEQTSPISLNEADEFNQEDFADFDGNTVFVPYDAPNFEEAESSTTTLDPSNMHEFHQEEGIDFEETFIPVARLEAVRELKFFLGLQVHQSPRGIFISQSQYAIELLKKHGMDECISMSTPMVAERRDADLQGTPTYQMTYHRMIGGLIYLTASQPDIAFTTFVCARYQARPTVKHLKEV
ncbi:hypothetical protein Tco_1299010, partial [Tanacetum coccineum]